VPRRLEIDASALRELVSKAIGTESIEPGEWRRESIHSAFNQSTGGLYRISGAWCDRGQIVPWSLVVKVVQASDDPFGGSSDPRAANYWRREPLIYGSGVLDDLPGIRAPRCFGVDEQESRAWIWLEDVRDGFGSRWSPDRYRLAARCLGRFNGAYVTGRPLPPTDHMTRRWLRAFVGTFRPAMEALPVMRDHPMVQRAWPDGLLDRVLGLWEERELLLGALERLPQTFCHLDAFPRNLMVDRTTGDLVALDWSYAGVGAIGTEVAPMVAASLSFHDAEPEDAEMLDAVVFDAYMDGLRATGWEGDSRQVRFGSTAAAALHYGLFPLGVFLADDGLRARFERLFAHPASDLADRWAKVTGFLLDQADEARDLLRSIP
jgi:phosphotransferase family enzyme